MFYFLSDADFPTRRFQPIAPTLKPPYVAHPTTKTPMPAMETAMERESAKIILFRPRANMRAATQSMTNDAIATLDFGAGWYHDNAIREDIPRGRASVVRLLRS
jgi:hypothetical protein